MKTILITGVSSGIGRATAQKLDHQGNCRFILCGRNHENLQNLQKALSSPSEIRVFDIKNRTEVMTSLAQLPVIDVLINNAGNAHGLNTFDQMELDDMEEMILSNVMGQIYVTKAVMPYLLKSNNGQIINLSSIAGKETYRNGTVYCASKSAVESLSQGLRLDLIEKGIKVTNLAPGAVNSNFSNVRFKGDVARAQAVYDGFEALSPEDIADVIAYILSVPDHVQIADITVLPKAQASATSIHKKS